MTVQRRASRPVASLAAQTLLFGAMAALLGVVANTMFLDAYGAGWLPATYIAIGIVGVAVSGTVARSAQRYELAAIALVVLGGAALGIAGAWLLARDGGAPWVSIPLLVLFPVLIQLGFVFVGSQAGRLLDIEGLKSSFPRIMAGFPVGAVLGSLVGAGLVAWLGRTEQLLLATALAQTAFAGLAWRTARDADRARPPAAASTAPTTPPDGPSRPGDTPSRPGLRRLLASRFVALLMGYQVLSALGSQLADFLVFDRAVVQYPDPAALAQFLAVYTAAMNIVSIGFLVLVAAPLLRRYGLRLGIPANPVVLGGFAVLMLVAWAVAGPASMVLLLAVSAARIADIALTDGMTRSSMQVTYQAVPERTRLAVQASIEGMGVPIAIALSGVLILVLDRLPDALLGTLLVTLFVCAAWTWVAVRLYGAYGPALVGSLRRRRLLAPDDPIEGTAADEAAAIRMVSATDARAARLGIELLGEMRSAALPAELAAATTDPRPEVRLAALAALARGGDERARERLAEAVRETARSGDVAARTEAARAAAVLRGEERRVLEPLLRDREARVRRAALGVVAAGDDALLGMVLAALDDPATAAAAGSAAGRLGDLVLPALDPLRGGPLPVPRHAARLVRSLTTPTAARDALLRDLVDHRDRELGLLALQRIGGDGPADAETATALDRVLQDDLAHADRVAGALDAFGDDHQVLRRALEDELELLRNRVLANRLARAGRGAIGPAIVALRDGAGGAVAVEALAVMLGPADAPRVLALVQRDGAAGDRPAPAGPGSDRRGPAAPAREAWIRALVEDRDDAWRSPWLRACAIREARLAGLLSEADSTGGADRVRARIDLAPAAALGDPVIDEELAAARAEPDRSQHGGERARH